MPISTHKRKLGLTLLCVLLATFVIASVNAGGWATITVENLPDQLIAGQTTDLTFTVRQHGVHLMDNLTPSLEAVQGAEKVAATITKEGVYYHAKLTVPQPGKWTITIKSSFMENNVTLLPLAAVQADSKAKAALSDSERGQRLFVAKGCLSCHQHDGAVVKGRFPFATNLTHKQYDDAHLARLLANPAQEVVPKNKFQQMPNLNLKPQEITALVAFLNAGKKV